MSNIDNNDVKECLPKLATGIRGLDKVLYGGFDINSEHLIIVIKGRDENNDKTIFGMQMLYGIAQSIKHFQNEYKSLQDFCTTPKIFSTYYKSQMIRELFLDYFISSGIQEIFKKKAAEDKTVNLTSTVFANMLFDCSRILCQGISNDINIPYSVIKDKIDSLIGDGVVYYNNRTDSLHFKYGLKTIDTKYNQIYRRKKELEDFFFKKGKIPFDKTKLRQYIGQYALELETKYYSDYLGILSDISNGICPDLISMDISNYKSIPLQYVERIFDNLESARISILIVDSELDIPNNRANVIIEFTSEIVDKFVLKYLQITKSDVQDYLPGLHQYKKRDYGVEVYPRIALYISERRYLQRALVYTHSDALTETYQQYQNRQKYYQDSPNNTYEDYEERLKNKDNEHFHAMYPKNFMDLMSIDLLNKIFMPLNPLRHLLHKSQNERDFMENEYMYGNAGFVTAVIGKSNTYKRFLTFGGVFGSAATNDHTLIIMMNKEESVIRRRLTCPARPLNGDMYQKCYFCYHYIHFMNICMGHITPEEFLYYLEKQIEVTYDGSAKKRIRRIVIDDLQILDYCFPRLKNDGLFLAALVELCRVNDIILYVLCDTKGGMAPALRSLADNVVFTSKDNCGHPLILVEKFAGYTNTPSKMYCGKVKNVDKLFRCMESYDSKDIKHFDFQSNIVELEDVSTSMFKDVLKDFNL